MNVLLLQRHRWSTGLAMALVLLATLSASGYAAARAASLVDARFDLTGNQVVNDADLAEAGDRWATTIAGGQPGLGAANADLNGDSTVDVADVQLVAAQLGQATTALGLDAVNRAGSLAQAELTLTVNSGASGSPIDTNFGDASPGNGACGTASGSCTLQAAVQEANARPGPERIVFDIRGEGGACPDVVRILPNLDYERWLQIDANDDTPITIDGYTQCGASPNTEAVAGNADIRVEIVGTKLGAGGVEYAARDGVNGLEIKSNNVLIRGLSFYNWDRQIELSAPGALYNQIQGNFIGTDRTNNFLSKSRVTHHGEGVRVQYGASYTVIGCGAFAGDGSFQPCTDPAAAYAARNIVAGNGNDGIHIERQDSHHNHIVGNYIGVAQDGRRRLDSGGVSLSKNYADGVDFEAGANNNWLGGEGELDRNIIAGNGSEGIEISHETQTQENRVVGNWFGLDAYGDAAGNGGSGISFEDTVNHNYAYRNYVGSNGQHGIRGYVLADYNQIFENVIGLNAAGAIRPNARHGVYLMGGSQHNMVRNNTIAHNGDRGVVVSTESDVVHNYFGESYYNTISQNSIYGNFREGIRLTNREDPQPRGNENLAKPLIVNANTTLVVGTACPNCVLEVFIADKAVLPEPGGENSGEGKTYVTTGSSNGGGEFAITLSGVSEGQLLTITATDQSGNTSEFSRNFRVGSGPVATLTPQPTLTPTTAPPTPTRTAEPAPDGGFKVGLPLLRR